MGRTPFPGSRKLISRETGRGPIQGATEVTRELKGRAFRNDPDTAKIQARTSSAALFLITLREGLGLHMVESHNDRSAACDCISVESRPAQISSNGSDHISCPNVPLPMVVRASDPSERTSNFQILQSKIAEQPSNYADARLPSDYT